jgi:hypothetical protein
MGVSPPPLWLPPIAITPEKVITALWLSVGGDSRDRRSPFLQTSAFFISYDDKWNSKKPFLQNRFMILLIRKRVIFDKSRNFHFSCAKKRKL